MLVVSIGKYKAKLIFSLKSIISHVVLPKKHLYREHNHMLTVYRCQKWAAVLSPIWSEFLH
jgi:hypothetical protein